MMRLFEERQAVEQNFTRQLNLFKDEAKEQLNKAQEKPKDIKN
jgi:hypothetical protein